MVKSTYLNQNAVKRILYVATLAGIGLLLASAAVFERAHAAELLTSQMGVGSRGPQVTLLQQFLATNSRIYPEAIISGRFGPLTRSAVMQFQMSYDISQTGYVGPITLAKINAIISSGLGLDTDAPVMSNSTAIASRTDATVSFNANENARARVYYDTSVIGSSETTMHQVMPYVSGTLALNDGALRTAQSVSLTGLQPGRTYFYVVEAIDASGNVSMSTPATFATNP